ncbi:MAG TPA: hypothetical protein VLX09_11600 [Stellaceae bacterium]|nr:hypothetical protein [Stellaceae bacterium]
MMERAKIRFSVKETADGVLWICAEPLDKELPILRGGNLGFDLRPGATIEQASEIARFMDQNIRRLTYSA